MDNQNQNPEGQQPQNPNPSTPPAGLPPSQRQQKVIQPSEEMIKEMASTPDSYYSRDPAPKASTTQNTQASPTKEQPQNNNRQFNPSNIYPEATNKYQPESSTHIDDKKDSSESHNFSNGYSLGGTIFWLQLLAGLVLGLILLGIDYFALKTATVSVIAIVSLLYYLVEFFIVAYIPYNTLKSNNIEEPFWLTIFGIATQSIIVATLFELVISLLIRSVINHGVPQSLAHIGGSGFRAISIAVYIGFFIASYFLTKLSWGIAFSGFGKIKNKTIIKAIGIGVIVIIVGGIAYHYLTLHSSKNNLSVSEALATSNNSSNFAHFNINEANPPFSVNFYKDSVINRVQGQVILENIKPYGANLIVNTSSQPAPTSCLGGETFTFYSQSDKGLGCYLQGGTDGYIQADGQNYDIALRNSNGVSLQAAESIFNSIKIE